MLQDYARNNGNFSLAGGKRQKLNPLKERFFKQIANLPIKTMFPGKLKMLILQIL